MTTRSESGIDGAAAAASGSSCEMRVGAETGLATEGNRNLRGDVNLFVQELRRKIGAVRPLDRSCVGIHEKRSEVLRLLKWLKDPNTRGSLWVNSTKAGWSAFGL